MLYNLVVQLVQYCLFHCTFDCLQLPRLGWRPSALLGFACAVLHYCAPQCTIFKLNAFIATRRARAPGSNECIELENGALGRAIMQNSTSKAKQSAGAPAQARKLQAIKCTMKQTILYELYN